MGGKKGRNFLKWEKMGDNSFAFNSLAEWNFQIIFSGEFEIQLCTRPEKLACLSLKNKRRRRKKPVLIARFPTKNINYSNLFSYRSSK